MKRFQFRLAPLLRLREGARNEQRARLAEAYQAEAAIHERQQALKQSIAAVKGEQHQSQTPGRVDVDRLLNANRYVLVLAAEAQHLSAQAEALAVEIDKRRQSLVVADRDVRVLEKLREAQRDLHARGAAAWEMKEMDEIAARTAMDGKN